MAASSSVRNNVQPWPSSVPTPRQHKLQIATSTPAEGQKETLLFLSSSSSPFFLCMGEGQKQAEKKWLYSEQRQAKPLLRVAG